MPELQETGHTMNFMQFAQKHAYFFSNLSKMEKSVDKNECSLYNVTQELEINLYKFMIG